jgi:osmotically-inducible protein OsmY
MAQDRQLQEAVLTESMWEPSFNAAHVGVTAHNGIVTLTGHVEYFLEKRAAEKAATELCAYEAIPRPTHTG